MSEKILVSEKQIKNRIEELAKEIARDYHGKAFILIGILKGSIITVADLMRALYKLECREYEITFVTLRSYAPTETTSKDIILIQDTDIDVKDREVLIVDDIFDTGKSFRFVDKLFRDRGAKSVEGLALLTKPSRHEVVYRPKYIGFEVPNLWVEGYGMDFDEKGRGNPEVIASKVNE